MAQFSRTWWGQKFIAALEQISDTNRLARGRTYARNGKVIDFQIDGERVTAQVRGSVNPYFGVYTEPLYLVSIEFQPISKAKWAAVVALMASKASLISRLMLNEMPETLEDSFATLGLHLLPYGEKDFATDCTCPDWSNPCKHIAGVHYLLAAELDSDPFLLFELRGLSRQALQAELAKSLLGQALAEELSMQQSEPLPSASYFTKPQTVSASPDLKHFWQGEKRLPQTVAPATAAVVPAILVKKQGDFPVFWTRDNSFIETMEELYQRVKTKNKDLL
ncbi:MAG: hypothetical protein HC886_09120 [Leptolyngbyaceae cyanobacterium SM1_1_3]|nr:hypothetical protein [Leptolyngbyaceae cyanobacterium SM1_1_3]NJN04450.1 hypothetical protein [Leptolyngbyaceae cyanobacterium RM1_1_2]NJO10057.1 hypothetical protein [Leptolyngbyaceae cyanobacterium SL_1_1]